METKRLGGEQWVRGRRTSSGTGRRLLVPALLFLSGQLCPLGAQEDLPPRERLLQAVYGDLFELQRFFEPHFWEADLNLDRQEDLALVVRSRRKMGDAWRKLPLYNPPFELVSRGEIEGNPLYRPQYSIREGETYLVIFHGRPPGWRELSIGESFILQDVCEEPPQLIRFEAGDRKVPGFQVRYQDQPGLLYWGEKRYLLVLKE